MTYLIAYDIANPKRLRRVARRLERKAIRVQKSVYRFHGNQAAVKLLLDQVRPLLDIENDVLAVWRLSHTRRDCVEFSLGKKAGAPLNALILSRGTQIEIADKHR